MLLSSFEFGSYLTYCPRGENSEIIKSRKITYSLKHDRILRSPSNVTTTSYLADILAQRINQTPINNLLGPDVTLVPAPKSAKFLKGSLWVPERLANALVDVGLGKAVATILERIRAVSKAASSTSKDRPKAIDHYNTIRAHLLLESPQQIVIVDDVITRGATMLGIASRLTELYPKSEIRGFAMVRTISNPDDFIRLEDPCLGDIQLKGNQTHREP